MSLRRPYSQQVVVHFDRYPSVSVDRGVLEDSLPTLASRGVDRSFFPAYDPLWPARCQESVAVVVFKHLRDLAFDSISNYILKELESTWQIDRQEIRYRYGGGSSSRSYRLLQSLSRLLSPRCYGSSSKLFRQLSSFFISHFDSMMRNHPHLAALCLIALDRMRHSMTDILATITKDPYIFEQLLDSSPSLLDSLSSRTANEIVALASQQWRPPRGHLSRYLSNEHRARYPSIIGQNIPASGVIKDRIFYPHHLGPPSLRHGINRMLTRFDGRGYRSDLLEGYGDTPFECDEGYDPDFGGLVTSGTARRWPENPIQRALPWRS